MESIGLVMTTVGSEEQGIKIAETLVEKGLAACVNIIKRIHSIYRWKGEIWDDEEFLLLVKTRVDLFDEVRATIKKLHSYELPELFCIPIEKADAKVKAWILETTLGDMTDLDKQPL